MINGWGLQLLEEEDEDKGVSLSTEKRSLGLIESVFNEDEMVESMVTGGNHFNDKKQTSACRPTCIMPRALMRYLILCRHHFITLMAGRFFIFHKFVRQFQCNFISLSDNFTRNFILLPA
jgi:hypothetical protein